MISNRHTITPKNATSEHSEDLGLWFSVTKRPSSFKLYQIWSDPAQTNTMFEQLDSITETVQIKSRIILISP